MTCSSNGQTMDHNPMKLSGTQSALSHIIINLNTISFDLNQLITISCLLCVPLSTVKTRNIHTFFTSFDFYFKYLCQSDCNNGTECTAHASGRKGVKNNCNTATDKEIRVVKMPLVVCINIQIF